MQCLVEGRMTQMGLSVFATLKDHSCRKVFNSGIHIDIVLLFSYIKAVRPRMVWIDKKRGDESPLSSGFL
jgi:hypothetical protein